MQTTVSAIDDSTIVLIAADPSIRARGTFEHTFEEAGHELFSFPSSKGLKLYLTIDTNLNDDVRINTYQYGDRVYTHDGFVNTGRNEITLQYPSRLIDTGEFRICVNALNNDESACNNADECIPRVEYPLAEIYIPHDNIRGLEVVKAETFYAVSIMENHREIILPKSYEKAELPYIKKVIVEQNGAS